ncbi:3-deoxy-manno-octulosonate cytidylyltransferase [Hydrogenimonas thermophila]|uniref:3-deoxy-manno-octulosonate cytidylyltransferase (CMP-KDO synthetase) n=1 Tax=Hydrogenimonas thermophila TaxID=223786 RepID=A0A1I5MT32_9BACT|nr:3-deoxy-manno-octulosonate cytidylyltransferase [Hydrogenimonas thermophila]WOE68914.1 3-deoxy-manno-octulosonate cytidylyltransferase [Hydrogenimonas thermophila]WOE71421.1 3-deoxy-manno-octulosonate cytidylyltransferase [Hydrogenimonas thermophila]SFP12640.1 3-deoxy-manno-octulosonate cytidylyltransferase (CMP-KDO synthetase) [Hydrogenimonas thermophila]
MIIIPARLGSTRFPKKVLADIGGTPMVVATANAVKSVDDVAVATDSKEVMDICKSNNIKAVMTSSEHKSGTDRINEAAARLGLDDNEIIINVQADEPFIEPEVVEKLKQLVESTCNNNRIMICSAYKAISKEDAKDPNIVKVITDESGFAIYFSRSMIPYDRDGGFDSYKGHLGLYGFTRRMLENFCNLPHAPLEHIEKLEQLRALSHGYAIAMTEVKTESFGIDTPEDLQRAIACL